MRNKLLTYGLSALLLIAVVDSRVYGGSKLHFDFYGDTIDVGVVPQAIPDYTIALNEDSIAVFYDRMEEAGFDAVVAMLNEYKAKNKPDDWLYYQLIRRTAQSFSPKECNYYKYTLYKWYFLTKTGYDAVLSIAGDKLLFYVQCDENIYDIPSHTRNGKQYVCLNYHDYGSIDFATTPVHQCVFNLPGAVHPFSYKLTSLPGFTDADYEEKELAFNYQDVNYRFRVKLNTKVKNIFANYPVADYQLYFSLPLSSKTYQSLIPQLKENVKEMSTREGVGYLMRFTRYAFLYQKDTEHFGKEKRLLPEQTLLYDGSDCEDRAALFFCLVKEIYNLPMIVLAYPEHVSIAVKFDKPIGKPIIYKGEKYTICEPTPQKQDIPMGRVAPEASHSSFQVAFAYSPTEQK